tara:strand:- start:4158 stop:4349 length:192 start_codon:yes stop_codon:yes gene_type:complete
METIRNIKQFYKQIQTILDQDKDDENLKKELTEIRCYNHEGDSRWMIDDRLASFLVYLKKPKL